MNEYRVTDSIVHNKKVFQEIFSDCADIKMVDMRVGADKQLRCMAAYIEIVSGAVNYGASEIGRLIGFLSDKHPDEIRELLKVNGKGLTDVTLYDDLKQAAQGLLTGDMILFVDGLEGDPWLQ